MLGVNISAWRREAPQARERKEAAALGEVLKASTGNLRPAQHAFLARIRGAGGVAFVARDCRDVRRELGRDDA